MAESLAVLTGKGLTFLGSVNLQLNPYYEGAASLANMQEVERDKPA